MGIEDLSVPYVVSEDVSGLVQDWADLSDRRAPSDAYFWDLSLDVQAILSDITGATVELVPENELREGIHALASASLQPVISFDRAYLHHEHPNVIGHIDVTRAVGPAHEDLGLLPRPGYPALLDQLAAFQSSSSEPVTLLDDVIFSGEGVVAIAQKLEALGRPVVKIVAGIAISEGITRLENIGIEVEALRTYESVMDEVCLRDFLAGTPMSGRTVIAGNEHWSAPYFAPFGDATKWASIPESQGSRFAAFCLAASTDLWHEIGRLSGEHVTTSHIPRRLNLIDESGLIINDLPAHCEAVSAPQAEGV